MLKNTILFFLCISQVFKQITNAEIIAVSCKFYYDYYNRYSCEILGSPIINSTDFMEIIGIHLENHTNFNVTRASFALMKIPQFNGEVMKIFENLKIFEFSSSETIKVHADAFDSCKNLEELNIMSNPLTTLPAKLLKNCENLKSFTLSNCKVTHLPSDLFGATTKLETFNVYHNKLRILPPKILLNMKNLSTFRASTNLLTEIDSTVFKDAEKLETFSISENVVEDIYPVMTMLSKSLNLKYISLEDNHFDTVDFSLFTKYKKLEMLSVGNRLSAVDIKNWEALPVQISDLTVLGLNSNIPETGFHPCKSLSRLTLGGPGITDLKKDTFKDQKHLDFLHLQPTNLTTLHPEIFSHLSNLTALLFEYSQVEELPEGLFASLSKLGSGDYSNSFVIRFNNIKKLNLNSFGQHQSLKSFDLSMNKIDAIERGFFSRFNLNITHLDFSGNRCASDNLYNKYDLDNDKLFEKCFKNWDNWDEITTITPGSGYKHVLNGILIAFILSFWVFSKYF